MRSRECFVLEFNELVYRANYFTHTTLHVLQAADICINLIVSKEQHSEQRILIKLVLKDAVNGLFRRSRNAER